MCTLGDNGDIIILSDDDEDDAVPSCEPSVLIVEVEDEKTNDVVAPQTSLDEDLVVTFSRRAEVLPHARYDCPIHPFTTSDSEVSAPVANNKLICDQCFCYICDKLASECEMWCHGGVCHCNSHKRSDFWNNLRNSSLLGRLKTFNLTLSEIDAHLRLAEVMMQSFRQELSARFSTFLQGRMLQECGVYLPQQQGLIYDYSPVYRFVSSFLDKVDQHDDRAAAIMRLGAAEDFIRHFQNSGCFVLQSPIANAEQAKLLLMRRVVEALQRQMVMSNFTPEFTNKLQEFYKKLYFPAEMKSMRNSLCIRPWDDVLLTSVLKGQNVSGLRKDKGKKNVLIEPMSVVLLRSELLQRQCRYRELCRYLRVVQTDDPRRFQPLQDLIPFFMCLDGDFTSACHSLFPALNAPASRLTPQLFVFYLRVFETATAPTPMVSQPSELCNSGAKWEPIKNAVPLKRLALVKFALRAQRCCSAVFTDALCWTRLLQILNSPCGLLSYLAPPSPQFLHEARDLVKSVLLQQQGSNIHIPRYFLEVYPDQALLLLVTGALAVRILSSALSPALPVLKTFKENVWALHWLWESFSGNTERITSFLHEITQEVEKATDKDSLLLLHSIISTLSSAQNWDQQPSF